MWRPSEGAADCPWPPMLHLLPQGPESALDTCSSLRFYYSDTTGLRDASVDKIKGLLIPGFLASAPFSGVPAWYLPAQSWRSAMVGGFTPNTQITTRSPKFQQRLQTCHLTHGANTVLAANQTPSESCFPWGGRHRALCAPPPPKLSVSQALLRRREAQLRTQSEKVPTGPLVR